MPGEGAAGVRANTEERERAYEAEAARGALVNTQRILERRRRPERGEQEARPRPAAATVARGIPPSAPRRRADSTRFT